MLILKSPREIELMRAAGRVVYSVLQRLRELIRPGVTTSELNGVAEEIITQAGGEALFKGVRTSGAKRPFPSVICASVNDVVVHGIANGIDETEISAAVRSDKRGRRRELEIPEALLVA